MNFCGCKRLKRSDVLYDQHRRPALPVQRVLMAGVECRHPHVCAGAQQKVSRRDLASFLFCALGLVGKISAQPMPRRDPAFHVARPNCRRGCRAFSHLGATPFATDEAAQEFIAKIADRSVMEIDLHGGHSVSVRAVRH